MEIFQFAMFCHARVYSFFLEIPHFSVMKMSDACLDVDSAITHYLSNDNE